MLQATYRVVAPEGKREEVVAVLLGLKGPADVSEGCCACRIYQDLDDHNALTCLQLWRSREDLEAHLRSERFRRLIPYIEVSTQRPEVNFSALRKLRSERFLAAVNGPQDWKGTTPMATDLRIVKSAEFVHMTPGGQFDLEATRRGLSDVLWACAMSKTGRVLLDLRDATGDMGTGQLSGLASVAREVAPPAGGHRVALVTRPEWQHDRAELVAGDIQERGWNLRVFTDYDEAHRWLVG